MYWKSVMKLDPGWSLFTHMVAPGGARVEKGGIDDTGPLRARTSSGKQALGPSDWQPGKVYVDEQELEMPQVNVPEISVLVGVWKEMSFGDGGHRGLRLSVISGPSDKQERGIVVTVPTGARWPEPKAKTAPSEQASPSGVKMEVPKP